MVGNYVECIHFSNFNFNQKEKYICVWDKYQFNGFVSIPGEV